MHRVLFALLCFFVVVTAWEPSNCEDKVTKAAISEAEILIKKNPTTSTYRVVKPLHCMTETSELYTRIGISLLGADTTQKSYVHNYVFRHTLTGDYEVEKSTVVYAVSSTDMKKLPFEDNTQ